MAKAKDDSRIKNIQQRANRLWQEEMGHWNKEASRLTVEAAKSSSESLKKSHATKIAHATECAEYCRAKIV